MVDQAATGCFGADQHAPQLCIVQRWEDEPVGLETSMRFQVALEKWGVEFLAETKSHGLAMRVRKGVVKEVEFNCEDADTEQPRVRLPFAVLRSSFV